MTVSRRRVWLRFGLLGLCVAALLAFTLHSLRLSDASFAAASANDSNVFIAGTFGHVNSRNGQVMLQATGMEPGDSSVGTMTLTGTGSLAGAYTLTPVSLTDVPATPALSGTLSLTIEDTTGAPVTLFDDVAANLGEEDLGVIAPGQTRSYRFTLEYPEGPNISALQGATMTLRLQVSGVTQ